MSYTINLSTGIVYRDYDGVQVAPANSEDDPNYVEYIRWITAGNHPKEITVPVSQGRKITKLAFRNRFTTTEKITLELASLDDPTATALERQQKAGLRVYLKDLDNATYIDLERQETISGVFALVSLGLLTNDRANAILLDPIQSHEVHS